MKLRAQTETSHCEASGSISYHSPERLPSMAGRSIVETLKHLLLTASLWHVVYILSLFIFTSVIWDTHSACWIHDGLLGKNFDPWFTVYTTASDVLMFQLIGFSTAFIARLCYETKCAESTESGNRVRQEEPSHIRQSFLVIMGVNIVVSVAIILWALQNAIILRERRAHHTLTSTFISSNTSSRPHKLVT